MRSLNTTTRDGFLCPGFLKYMSVVMLSKDNDLWNLKGVQYLT